MPASWALVRQAAPESESTFTISSTLTPALIIPSQSVANFEVSP
jgi:hypothetical protein